MPKVCLLSDGTFKLDGGAMHGVVPKALWEKQNQPDEKNRILLAVNSLLIEYEKEKILIEPGIGSGHSEKFASLYAIDKKRAILSDLNKLGISPEEITMVVPTHLHFDHAGGVADWGTGKLLFPNARHIIQEKEWEAAMNPHPKNQASYLPEFLEPLKKAKLEMIDGEKEIVPGVKLVLTGGHTHGHQAVFIETQDKVLAFPGDLIPTRAHVNPLWVMAYDVDPEKSIKMKRWLIENGTKEAWTFVLVHEPVEPVGKIKLENNKYSFNSDRSGFLLCDI
ncbi:MAG: MBL fold metallo-hydrolase [Firmicutes bacterium]|nr:MBL fold metallo-hydrolase [Bacillota bacterium]